MNDHTIVAVYDTAADAQAAIRDLEDAGIARDAIETHAEAGMQDQTERVLPVKHEGGGFFAWLFGEETPEYDRAVYRDSLDRGGSVVSVMTSEGNRSEVTAILERNNAVDVDERGRSLGYAPSDASADLPPDAPLAARAATIGTTEPRLGSSERPMGATPRAEEDKIQLAEEELNVGKRTLQGGKVRVRSRVVEAPVSEEVNLRDERVTLERRAPSGSTAPGVDPFAEKTIEMTETREEPVVSKTARVVEEVVVGKDVRDRTETVRDTVRRQEVDLERTDADGKTVSDPRVAGQPRT